jgi:hypothetical protein
MFWMEPASFSLTLRAAAVQPLQLGSAHEA